MRENRLTVSVAAVIVAVLGLVLALGSPAIAGDEDAPEAKKVKKITIEKKIACEAEDCEHARHHKMIIKKHGDMDPIHVECDGEDCDHEIKIIVRNTGDMEDLHSMIADEMDAACEGEDCRAKVVVIGKDGEMHKAHAMAGHKMIWSDDECEGEDCAKKKVIFIGEDGETQETSGMAGHPMVWSSEDCEGEDCKQERHVIIRKSDGLHEMHHAGEFSWVAGDGEHLEFFDGKGGFLGVHLTDLTEELRAHFGAPAAQGVMVGKVQSDSAAESAGLEVGDIVLSVDGESIGSAGALSRTIRSREGGESVKIGILRGGTSQTVTAVLGEQEAKMPRGMHTMVAFCDEGEDCDVEKSRYGSEYDCGGAEECHVEIECEADECTCTANGEAIDCEELNLPHH